MRHDQGFSVGLVKRSRRYREYGSTIDEGQDTAKYKLSATKHIHAGSVSRVAFAKKQDDEEEGAALLFGFDEGYKLYDASTLEVRIGVARGEGHVEPIVYYLNQHDINNRKARQEIVLPRPLLTRRLPENPLDTEKNTSPGCVSVFLTRGRVSGGDWTFTPEKFQRIDGKNGETLCFEFQCRPKGFNFSVPERLVEDGPRETKVPFGGPGAPNSETHDAAHMTATTQNKDGHVEVSAGVPQEDGNAPLPPPSGIERSAMESPVELPAKSPTLSRKRKADDEMTRDVSAPKVAGPATTSIEAKTTVSNAQAMSNQEARRDAPTEPENTDELRADRCGFQSGNAPPAPSRMDAPASTTGNFIDLTSDDVVIKREPVGKQCSSKHVIPQVEEDQDEEDLELELKKIEIQQKLKAIRRKKAVVKTEE